MTDDIKSRLTEKFKIKKKYYKYGQIKSHLNELQEKTDDDKEMYVRCTSNKLIDPLTASKKCYSTLNCLLNNRKIPAIPRLLVNGDIVSNFSEKAELF